MRSMRIDERPRVVIPKFYITWINDTSIGIGIGEIGALY